MSRFHSLKVVDVARETADAVSIAFEVPAHLKSDFEYKQGQYLTLKMIVNGEELRRSYSICSCPIDEPELRVAVKKVKDGRVSTYINDHVKVGDLIEVMVPMGNFHTEMDVNHRKNYVLFAGGSGITPMMSIIKTVLKAEPQSSVILFYGNNDFASIIFQDQLQRLAASNLHRLKVYNILNAFPSDHPELQQGMMTKDKVISLVNNYVNVNLDNEYFVCGPGPMMENVANALKQLNISEERVHIEYFSAPPTSSSSVAVAAPKPESANVEGIQATIILDKETHQLILNKNETILEAALRIDLDPPFACQGGSCCTCRALLEEGEVKMDVNYGLSKSEIKKGYILTCQSRPTTDKVVVNYDKG